jgi:D-3-phosphoglycerate dehydrogenase
VPFELTTIFLTELREAIRVENGAFVVDQLKDLYAPDIAEILNELEIEEAKYVYKQLDASTLPAAFQYLIQSDKVMLSSHIAGWTHESNEKIARILAEKILKIE